MPIAQGDSWFDLKWLPLVKTDHTDDAISTIVAPRLDDPGDYARTGGGSEGMIPQHMPTVRRSASQIQEKVNVYVSTPARQNKRRAGNSQRASA